MKRRKFLLSVGTGSIVGLAGCSGSNGSSGESEDTEDSSNEDADSDSDSADNENTQPKVRLLSHEFYVEQFSSGVRGTAVNSTDGELNYVEAEAVFLDQDGTQIDEGLDNVTGLAASREWEFECAALDTETNRIERYEIVVSEGF